MKWYDFLISKKCNISYVKKLILRMFRGFFEPLLNNAFDNGTYYESGKGIIEKMG